MVDLTPEERARLVEILTGINALGTEQGRNDMLQDAGLKKLASQIDKSGDPTGALSRIVRRLEKFGRRREQPDIEVLGVLINWVMNMVGVEEQAELAALISKHHMTAPIASLPRIAAWSGRRSEAEVFEKIIGQSSLHPVAFLERGLEIAKAVAYVGLPNQSGSGSGFLVARDLVMTNHHVIQDRGSAEQSIFRFNFENDWTGAARTVVDYRAKPQGLFHCDERLDFALIELAGDPGATWGWLPLRPGSIGSDSRINIIQHPGGQHKQVAIQTNLVEFVDDHVVQYVTSTLPGSSGSPGFNDSWELVALHHAGGDLLDPGTQRRHYRNEGIRISAIANALPPEILARVTVPCSPALRHA